MQRTSLASRLSVSLLFILLYAAFLFETGMLFFEFAGSGFAWSLATLETQNFIFFPVAGLLVLIAFWSPTVYVFDALAGGRVHLGRPVLGISLLACILLAVAMSAAFNASSSRSMYEVDPGILAADTGSDRTAAGVQRAPISDILTRMRILAADDTGLSSYGGRCDTDWLTYSEGADRTGLCFPTGSAISVAECCRAKGEFRSHINALHAQAPSQMASIHRIILPIKGFFLFFLLLIGILLVQYRQSLTDLYGEGFTRVSFSLAVGGVVMLMWPLLNASYLETMSLLTGDGAQSAYAVSAPLIALGFGAWALLLMFFHFRSFPSQIESAARIGGVIVAALGVLRYEQITAYISQTLGIGGSVVAVTVFAVAIAGLIATILTGADDRIRQNLPKS